ncbi:hypothetical protein F5Y16DRAFT_407490 [Xylariaceae sp. FL0255]|nr:hypothetical protein F5Y16DRAFT_407490 [Xylariaceae sp. FL0255]
MSVCNSPNLLCGWISGPNNRGTLSIIYSSLSTIWLCTWTCLCLNIPGHEKEGWLFLLYKFRWQIFTILFPEVLVVTAAEQWISAKQSVGVFNSLGYHQWTIRHGFFADMGGILLAPNDSNPFPINSYQLSYLVRLRYLPMPQIEVDDIRAVNKADGIARSVTLFQILWFTISCIGRAAARLPLTALELETLAFILCTVHTFYFWYHKPLDPFRSIVVPLELNLDQLSIPGLNIDNYQRTPLEVLGPTPDPRSLISPFWFGFKGVFRPVTSLFHKHRQSGQTIPNSASSPPEGAGRILTLYLIIFQIMYYGLHIGVGFFLPFPTEVEFNIWEGSSIVEAGLIGLFLLGLPLGNYFAPWLGGLLFRRPASNVLEISEMLPMWAQLVVHGPFVLAYLAARVAGLVVAGTSLRALPAGAFQEVPWSNLLPHL